MPTAMVTTVMTTSMPTTENQSATVMAVAIPNMPSPSLAMENKIIDDEESNYNRESAVDLED